VFLAALTTSLEIQLDCPPDCPYAERQYTVEDPGGHRWTFSQTIADVAPEEWGGALEG
jgi:uncharacterized glyoxalase superfamily protein PhnB